MIRIVIAGCLLIACSSTSRAVDEVEYWDESAYAGNGVVEWRVWLRNNGVERLCCRMDLEATRFSFGNRDIATDSSQICAYPGKEEYHALQGVTTVVGTTGSFGKPIRLGNKSPDIVASGKFGSTKFRVSQCVWGLSY